MKKKARTTWKYEDFGAGKDTWIKIGLIKPAEMGNPNGYKYDCIRIQIRSAWEGQGDIDFSVRMDEAASISAGFSKILAYIMANGHPELAALANGHKKGDL